MRTLDPAASAALDDSAVVVVILVEMALTETIRLCSASHDITFGGQVFQAIGDLGSVDEVKDEMGEVSGLNFSLSGVRNDNLSIAINEPIRGKAAYMRLALLSISTLAVLDAPLVWSGTCDQMPVEFGKVTSAINVVCQHRGVTFARPKPLRYTDADQQALFPGDTSLRFVAEQSQHPDVWPAASFFRI
jgi:hypothetical protein